MHQLQEQAVEAWAFQQILFLLLTQSDWLELAFIEQAVEQLALVLRVVAIQGQLAVGLQVLVELEQIAQQVVALMNQKVNSMAMADLKVVMLAFKLVAEGLIMEQDQVVGLLLVKVEVQQVDQTIFTQVLELAAIMGQVMVRVFTLELGQEQTFTLQHTYLIPLAYPLLSFQIYPQ